jgi:hypothetical protein
MSNYIGYLRTDAESLDGLQVAVSGGRDYADKETLWGVLDNINETRGIATIFEGACPVDQGGADELARLWAKARQVNCVSVPAKPRVHKWPAAGPIRNREIGSLKPELWVLFPGGRGTNSARKIAQEIGCEIYEVI